MKNKLRRMLRRNYKRILQEEIENKEYDYRRITTDVASDKVMDPLEDAWAGGQNLHHQLDHAEVAGAEANVRGVETLRITESTLRSIIRQAIVEAKDQDGDGDNDFADVMMARMIASGKSKADAKKATRKHNEEAAHDEEELIGEPDINPDREKEAKKELEEMGVAGIAGHMGPMGMKRRR